MSSILKDAWSYRYFVASSIRKELTTPFSRSKLGGLWMLLHPLAQVAIYALILSNVLATKLPAIDNPYGYAIYLMAGLLCWNLFNDLITKLSTLFIDQGNLIKKMQFPRITLPIIAIGTCLFNNLFLLAAMLVIFIALGQSLSIQLLWLLPLTIITVSMGAGIGITLGIFNVFLRDIGQIVPIVLQILFWFTPIVYPASIIPAPFQELMSINPIYALTNAYQNLILYGTPPSILPLLLISAFSAVMIYMAFFLFNRASSDLADHV